MVEQEIILGIILFVCIVWTIHRIVLCFKRIKSGEGACEGCSCACSTRTKSCENKKNDDFIEKKSLKRLQIQKIVVPLQPQSRNKRCSEKMKYWFLG